MQTLPSMNRPIVIHPYDPSWPVMYETEQAVLLEALGSLVVQIEHMGSTSVPGLPAKPVIDICVGIRSLVDAPACVQIMQELGYVYEPQFEASFPDRRFCWKGTRLVHTVHANLVELTSDFWVDHILFRDYLRSHPEACQEYASLKQSLAETCVDDMPRYVDGKTDFIEGILKLCKGS